MLITLRVKLPNVLHQTTFHVGTIISPVLCEHNLNLEKKNCAKTVLNAFSYSARPIPMCR